jgi:hypothetical protein
MSIRTPEPQAAPREAATIDYLMTVCKFTAIGASAPPAVRSCCVGPPQEGQKCHGQDIETIVIVMLEKRSVCVRKRSPADGRRSPVTICKEDRLPARAARAS